MTTLSSAIDDLFADPHLARHALWHAGGTGSPLPVRIILRQPGRVGSFGETRLVVRFQHMTPGNRHARPRAFDPGVTRASTNGALAVDGRPSPAMTLGVVAAAGIQRLGSDH